MINYNEIFTMSEEQLFHKLSQIEREMFEVPETSPDRMEELLAEQQIIWVQLETLGFEIRKIKLPDDTTDSGMRMNNAMLRKIRGY